MSTINAAILVGLSAGLGLFLILRALLPVQPDLRAALSRQSDDTALDTTLASADLNGLAGYVGVRVYPYLAHASWMKIPYKDLAIIRKSVPQYLGDKVGTVLIALLWPPLLNALLSFSPGGGFNWSIPIGLALHLATLAFFLPDIRIREQAQTARDNFARHLGAYMEMVALVRANGSGTADALHQASRQGDSWVFLRLQEELQKADTAHRAPWDALRQLADEVDAPDLAELADQLILTGQGVSISDSMREAAKGLRHKNLSKEQSEATSATKRLRVPLGILALVFTMIVIYPAGSAMLAAT